MGNPPDRGTGPRHFRPRYFRPGQFPGHVRGNGMIKRRQVEKAPISRSASRRRRPIMPILRRATRWSALVGLAGLAYGGFALSRSSNRDALLADAGIRAVAATASLGLVVEDI